MHTKENKCTTTNHSKQSVQSNINGACRDVWWIVPLKLGEKKSIFSERWINQYPSKVVPRLKRRTGFSFINQQTASHQIWLAHRASMKSRLNAVGQSGHNAVLNLELGAHVSWCPQLFFFQLINVPAHLSGLTAGTAPCVTTSRQWWMAGHGRRTKLRIKAELWAK